MGLSGEQRSVVFGWLVVIVILLAMAGGILFVWVKDRKLASVLEPPKPALPLAQTPAPPPPKPRLSTAERKAAEEALVALKGLQSVTTAGLNYSEYSRRLLDAKIQVDRYLDVDGADPDLRQSIRNVMDLYLLAGDAWNAKILERYERVAEDPRIDLCPSAKRDRDNTLGREYVPLNRARGIAVAVSSPTFWQCASERIVAINQRLKD